jgi:hypothetical protein
VDWQEGREGNTFQIGGDKMKVKYGQPTLWFCTHCGGRKIDVGGKAIKNRCKCGWYMRYRELMKGDAEGAKVE